MKIAQTHERLQADPTDPKLAPLQRALGAIQTKNAEVISRLSNVPYAASTPREPVTFTAGGTQTIAHQLGHVPTRWTAEDVTGGYGGFQRVSWDDRFIVIQSVFACTAVFRVE